MSKRKRTTVFRRSKKQSLSYDKGETILGVLSWIYIAFVIAMGDGFASWVSWVVLLAYGICIVAVSYFELSARNKTPTRTEIFFATLTKWIMRFFSGMMIVLLLVAFGYVIYSYFTNQAFDGKNTLIALVFIGFFIFCLVHYFIYGQRHKGFDINRAEYRRRKKRYHWKW